MTLHFVQLVMSSQNYRQKVSTEGCSNVSDFRCAIKNKYSHLLSSYSAVQLTLFQPDGTTEIDPETSVTDLKEIPGEPMVVTVDEFTVRAFVESSKKRPTYRGMSTEMSCMKYLDAIASKTFLVYDFSNVYRMPTMGDLLAAKDGQEGVTWHYRKIGEEQLTTTPLPSLFSMAEWNILKTLHAEAMHKIYDARLPQTSNQKQYIIIPHSEFATEYVESLKHIAAIAGVVVEEDDLIVKDEADPSI